MSLAASISPLTGYRGRLAPSPTGLLHLGHARTFWTACERARAASGVLVLRMEDLDRERSRAVFAQAALDDLHWLGLEWQEGPECGGAFGPYAQSLRESLYRAAWQQLLDGGWIYPCRCSRKDLQASVAAPHEGSNNRELLDDEPVYPGTCRLLSAATLTTTESAHWRFRVPEGEAVCFEDANLGPQSFVAGRDFGDFVVWRREGGPSYQLACVVDDAAMHITEVVRGEDLLKSTARQILLNRALGFSNPEWFHCRLVVDENGRRLAKRHDALSLQTLRERGFEAREILSFPGPKIGIWGTRSVQEA